MSRWRRRALIGGLGIAAVAFSIAGGFLGWQSIQVAWWSREAGADRRPFSTGMEFDEAADASWLNLVHAGTAGFDALARLLEHAEPAVWARASQFVAMRLEAWWLTNRARLRFDPEKRLWVIAK